MEKYFTVIMHTVFFIYECVDRTLPFIYTQPDIFCQTVSNMESFSAKPTLLEYNMDTKIIYTRKRFHYSRMNSIRLGIQRHNSLQSIYENPIVIFMWILHFNLVHYISIFTRFTSGKELKNLS